MKKTLLTTHFLPGLLVIAALFISGAAGSQTFLNGSFENNTAVTAANNVLNNLSNASFNALVSNCVSFGQNAQGMSGHLDLMTETHTQWGSTDPAHDGNWYVGIGSDPVDRLSLALSAPLVPGNSYTITFYDKGGTNPMPFEIGLATTPGDVGTWIYTTATGATIGVWTERTFTFVAPNHGQYITVKQQPAVPVSWAMLDDFKIVSAPCTWSVDLGQDILLCEGMSHTFEAGIVPGATYHWSNNSSGHQLVASQAGTYWVTVSTPACTFSDTVEVVVEPLPEVDFSVDKTSGCAPLDVTFSSGHTIEPGQIFTWNFGDGTFSTDPAGVSHTFPTGCYDISLTVTSTHGCMVTESRANLICADPKPVADFHFNPSTIYSDDPQVQFFNVSLNGESSEWSLSDGAHFTAESPAHTFPQDVAANYLVQLIVTSVQGCKDTVYHLVPVEHPYYLFVPNTFTPDGNEFNNLFEPVVGGGYDKGDYRLEIWDRWGELLFTSYSAQQGWDGMYNGKPVQDGIYVWRITVGDLHSDSKSTHTGEIQVLR